MNEKELALKLADMERETRALKIAHKRGLGLVEFNTLNLNYSITSSFTSETYNLKIRIIYADNNTYRRLYGDVKTSLNVESNAIATAEWTSVEVTVGYYDTKNSLWYMPNVFITEINRTPEALMVGGYGLTPVGGWKVVVSELEDTEEL